MKLRLAASYVYEAGITVYDVKGLDIVLGKRWMRDINRCYQIDHDSNETWIADNLREKTDEGRVHDLPGLHPLDVDKGMVELARFMGIHIIRKVELKNVSARLLKWAFLFKLHHCGDADSLLTDKLPGEYQEMLTEFQGLFDEQIYANLPKGR